MEGKEFTTKIDIYEESQDIINHTIEIDDIKFFLKIFPSKDNINLIFKLEKEHIQTYYYYAKYYLDDFKQQNKKFEKETNIKGIYTRMKDIIANHICKLEKEGLKYYIHFTKKSKEEIAVFTLRKKIVAQERLNDLLMVQIQESKIKIKELKKKITKLDKTIQNKNDIIDNINNDIINLSEVVNNLNTKVVEAEVNNKMTSSKENDDEIKKTYTINKEENELLKKNLTLTQEKKQPEINKDNTVGKRYISNNRKKKNKPKKGKNGNNSKEDNKNNKTNNTDENLYCFDNDVYKNKKAYETLILFNFISILIVMYLLCSIYALKSNLAFEKIKDQQEWMKKVTLLSLLDDGSEDDIGGIRENIVDFNLKNEDNDKSGDNSNNNKNNK